MTLILSGIESLHQTRRETDTVTLVRSGIRGLLKAADADLVVQLRAVLRRDDDYAGAGKPVCDYDDRVARRVWWTRWRRTRWAPWGSWTASS